MAEPKFTPGPWRRDGRAIEARAFDGSWRYICDKVRGGSPESSDANAHLIAAAPDLYAAGEAALSAIDTVLFSHEGQTEYSELLTAFRALESALNKACGEPPAHGRRPA